MPTDLKGWHPGERSIHKKLNYESSMATSWTWIYNGLPEEHREFHTSRLPFLPVTTLDATGRPWGSILAGHEGKIGFIRSSSNTTLGIKATVWDGDPLKENVKTFSRAMEDKMLVAGIGIEFSTRRRNKFAGWISKMDLQNNSLYLEVNVNQAIG